MEYFCNVFWLNVMFFLFQYYYGFVGREWTWIAKRNWKFRMLSFPHIIPVKSFWRTTVSLRAIKKNSISKTRSSILYVTILVYWSCAEYKIIFHNSETNSQFEPILRTNWKFIQNFRANLNILLKTISLTVVHLRETVNSR